MQEHTKIYFAFFAYRIASDCVCEICGTNAVDINHIKARGMGGNPAKDKNEVNNLMAMCRAHHLEYGDVPECRPLLKLIHLKFMLYNGLKREIAKLSPALEIQIKNAEAEHLNGK